ncbi:MAG: hypothetical protein O2904_02885 [bacterium]|nr:hypothetical protein [bacterium]
MFRYLIASVAIGFLMPVETLHPSYSEIDILRNEVIAHTNIERMIYNLPPLERSQLLTVAAQKHAEDMANHNFYAPQQPL